MRVTRVLTVLLSAGALVVAGCGESGGGGSPRLMGNPADRAFVSGMLPHHMLGVEMATVATERGESAFVKGLANSIVKTQNQEIDLLRAEDQTLAKAGVKKGKLGVPEHVLGMSGDVDELRTAKPFDRVFLRMMIPHHEGAVALAEAELTMGAAPSLKKIARSIIKTQEREIKEMREHLERGGKRAAAAHGGGHSG